MALTTSVLLEPLGGRHRRTQPPPPLGTTARELPELGPTPPTPPPPPPRESGTEVGLRIGAFAVGSIAAAADGRGRIRGAPRPRNRPARQTPVWSFDGEARFDLESGASHTSGGAKSSLVLGELAGCRHVGVLGLCAVVDAGSFRGQVPETARGPRAQASFYAAVGPRLGLEIPAFAGFALAAHADVAGVLTRTTIRVGDDELWTTPPVFFSLGVGFVRSFP